MSRRVISPYLNHSSAVRKHSGTHAGLHGWWSLNANACDSEGSRAAQWTATHYFGMVSPRYLTGCVFGFINHSCRRRRGYPIRECLHSADRAFGTAK
jgi:hypothetical protein